MKEYLVLILLLFRLVRAGVRERAEGAKLRQPERGSRKGRKRTGSELAAAGDRVLGTYRYDRCPCRARFTVSTAGCQGHLSSAPCDWAAPPKLVLSIGLVPIAAKHELGRRGPRCGVLCAVTFPGDAGWGSPGPALRFGVSGALAQGRSGRCPGLLTHQFFLPFFGGWVFLVSTGEAMVGALGLHGWGHGGRSWSPQGRPWFCVLSWPPSCSRCFERGC